MRAGRFIAPPLLDVWRKALGHARFTLRRHHDEAYWGGPPPTDLILDDPVLQGRMLFDINSPPLFDAVRHVTGCDPIGSFFGVIYRLSASHGDADRWHDDMDGNNLVAVSINLGRAPYTGGHLQIADATTRRVFFDDANTGEGDALIFRLSDDLKHRVSAVTSDAERTVFTGWFRRTPALGQWLRGGRGTSEKPEVRSQK